MRTGYLFIADRTKDIIITGGENVYSKEVEDMIREHPEIADCGVIGVPHPDWGETVVAVIVTVPRAHLTADIISAYLKDKLARYKIPRRYEFVDELPYTPSGNIMKFKLRETFSRSARMFGECMGQDVGTANL